MWDFSRRLQDFRWMELKEGFGRTWKDTKSIGIRQVLFEMARLRVTG